MNRLAVLAILTSAACTKVPLDDVQAGFDLADAAWFSEEDTLFLFWEVHAQQGIGDPSVIEVTYVTDDEEMPWTPLDDLPMVHEHVPVDCGRTALCGSASLAVPLEPRDVRLRLRYNRDGALALDAPTVFDVVGDGPAWSNRSLVVYGVFDEGNQRVQWRSRNQFPALRNEKVSELGLRREFTVADQRFGSAPLTSDDDPYGYGVECPDDFVPTGFVDVSTDERAVFDLDELPLGASDATTVCAEATVTDATGPYTTGAIARKNPEVRPAFPVLNSPAHDATPLKFFLGPCDRTISVAHEQMLRQRLQLGDTPTTCTDDWSRPDFVDGLVVDFRAAIESTRPAGNDMVLVVGLEQDEPEVEDLLEQALVQVLPDERFRSSPRVAGAFVLDSEPHDLGLSDLDPVTLWCPSTEHASGASATCAIQPDLPDLKLGPFTFDSLPILPTRDDYLDFIDTYSEAQAGQVDSIAYRTPEFATTTVHVPLGEYGAATFLNGEQIAADRADAFSYCTSDDPAVFVFRSDRLDGGAPVNCRRLGLPEEVCLSAALGLVPLQYLPDWHNALGESSYDLGVVWDFPYLLRMDYEVVTAGAVGAFGLSVPFGLATPAESYYGTAVWTADQFSLEDALLQCTRFCDHPTFDSAGVYHVTDPFRSAYAHQCYLPDYPKPGDGGFPRDP